MLKVLAIADHKSILPYLEARGLVKQYQKAKEYLLAGNARAVSFKERQPQNSGLWSFRINKQFRAFGSFRDGGILFVSDIDNHQ